MAFGRRVMLTVLSASTGISAMLAPEVVLERTDHPFVAVGEDLSETELQEVLELLGVSDEEFTEDTMVTVTQEDEERYLSGLYEAEQLEGEARLVCSVVAGEPESGVHVSLYNITDLDEEEFETALTCIGVEDITASVAAPEEMSGNAAVVGVMAAYSKMNGYAMEQEQIDLAVGILRGEVDLTESEMSLAERLWDRVVQNHEKERE